MTSKGEETRERILDAAFRLAGRDGLEGLSVNGLAGQLGLSKAAIFTHFKTREELHLATLQLAADHFVGTVMTPAFARPRGLPRLKAFFDNWLRRMTDPSLPGGCTFVAAAVELDDRPGKTRDFVADTLRGLLASLERTVRLAVDEGHFRSDLDCEQVAFELYGIILSFQNAARLLQDPKADRRARAAFARLIESASPGR